MRRRRSRRVYPRVCGGAVVGTWKRLAVAGLSPRVRGSPAPSAQAGQRLGSIPACAGEPDSAATAWRPSWVYPRVCGGARVAPVAVVVDGGLSPRVRGSPGGDRGSALHRGSIPACAGEPRRPAGTRGPMRVYPRVCGGAHRQSQGRAFGEGLSPRVRGSQAQRQPVAHVIGSIPACAGEPRRRWSTTCGPRVYPRVCGGAADGVRVRVQGEGLSPRVRGSP